MFHWGVPCWQVGVKPHKCFVTSLSGNRPPLGDKTKQILVTSKAPSPPLIFSILAGAYSNLLCTNLLGWETRNATDCDGRPVFIGLYFQLFGRSPRNHSTTISWIDQEVPTANRFQSMSRRRNALESVPPNDSHSFDPITFGRLVQNETGLCRSHLLLRRHAATETKNEFERRIQRRSVAKKLNKEIKMS